MNNSDKQQKNFVEELKEYLETTPREQIEAEWDKTKNLDGVGPTVDEFLANTKKQMNPIKDNRIVSNMTFALRLSSFLKDIVVNDPMSEEELDYMKRVAQSLLDHQIATATDPSEIDYLIRCGVATKEQFKGNNS